MSNKWPVPGPNNVPSYQMSGLPFVTSSAPSEVQCVSSAAAEVRDPTVVEFPFVTKFITIRNTGINELRVGFTERGVFSPGERLPDIAGGTSGGTKGSGATEGSNFFLIPTGSGPSFPHPNPTMTFEVRCKKVVFLSDAVNGNPNDTALSSSFSLIAGLTTIPASNFPALTGSITGSAAGLTDKHLNTPFILNPGVG